MPRAFRAPVKGPAKPRRHLGSRGWKTLTRCDNLGRVGKLDRLRRTFESVADTYDAARPDYPEQLFRDLVELAELKPGAHLLEIGCGTGKATRPLLELGYRITCVELGGRLAAHAQRKLAGFPVTIHVAPFETWSGPPAVFDMVFAATAWHWVPARVRYAKVHELLRTGGSLAFWSAVHAFPLGFDPFFDELREAYAAIGSPWEGAWPPPTPDEIPDELAAIQASGLFQPIGSRRYLWERFYTADEYVALLGTFSGHIEMNPGDRERLFQEVRKRVEARSDPRIRRHWRSILHVARRR